MKIGFVGLGNVGGKLARSLLRNKFNLTVIDLDQNLVKDFERQERAMKAVRDYAGVKEGFTNADAGRRKINNEMQLLARSFLTMTSGLKRDANREKALVKHPINPYHMDQESEFMGDFIDQNLAVEVEAKQM